VFYFYINEGQARLNTSSADLSGNEQTILFYDLYVSNSPKIVSSGLPSILSFQVVSRSSENGGDSGVVLFVPSNPRPDVLVPPHPILINQETVYLVNEGQILSTSLFLLIISLFVILLQ